MPMMYDYRVASEMVWCAYFRMSIIELQYKMHVREIYRNGIIY